MFPAENALTIHLYLLPNYSVLRFGVFLWMQTHMFGRSEAGLCALSSLLRRQWTPAATQHTYICRFDFLFGAVQYSQSPATHFCCSQLATRGCALASTWLHVLYVKVYINRIIWNRFKQQHEHSLYCGANLCNRCFIKKNIGDLFL